jgi:alpha-N-arabinofuranosidase
MILTRDDQMVLTPTYHVFEMYKVHQDAEFLPVEYATSEIATSDKGPVPSLSVTASRKDGVVNVDITNIDLKNGQTVLLTWDTLGKVKKENVSARILTADKINAFNDFGKEAAVAPAAFKDFKVTDAGIEIKAPAMSIIAIAIK